MNIRLGFIFCLIWTLSLGQHIYAQDFSDQIRISLEKVTQEKPHLLSGVPLKRVGDVYRFFAQREFQGAWSRGMALTERAYEMRFEIRQAKYDGLNPYDYHLTYLESFFTLYEAKRKINETVREGDLAELEIILTDAFFNLAEDLEIGKIDPAGFQASWDIPRKPKSMEYGDLLTESLVREDIRSGLAKLYPKTVTYPKGKNLMRELEEKEKTGDVNWKPIKTDKAYKVGDSNPAIPSVRERLAFWGFSPLAFPDDLKKFDTLLMHQVMRFQRDKGMVDDGVLGSLTLSALNESPTHLIKKIAVNLERLRWIPNEFFEGETIFVNIPSFQLVYRTATDTLFTTKVIVGTVKHQSPVFTAPMSYLVMSPFWNIPPSIARNETIPAIKRNPGYLERNHMEVVNRAGNPVSSSDINWNELPFPYLIRQKPGQDNALGLVKFMFPNPYNVYLHDTPAKQLFDREIRTFSHGCIRMQNPKGFAELLMKDMPEWNSDRIWVAMNQPKEQIVNLRKKIPVAIVYLTFVLDAKGNPQFRQDVYNKDEKVLSLLNK